MSRDLLRPRDLRAMWIYEKKLLKVSPQPVTFGDHRHCVSGEIVVLVWHVISQDNVIKRSNDFMGISPSRFSYHSAKFGGHKRSSSVGITVLVCHVIKGSSDFIGRSPSTEITILPYLVATGIAVAEICFCGWRARFHMLA